MFSRPKKQQQVLIDRQIHYLHQVIANKLFAQPALFDTVVSNLNSRRDTGMLSYGSELLWESILEQKDNEALFRSLLLANDSRTKSLRRQTIFSGILTEEEREEALANYHASAMD